MALVVGERGELDRAVQGVARSAINAGRHLTRRPCPDSQACGEGGDLEHRGDPITITTAWTFTPRPDIHGLVAFSDCGLRLDD